MTTSTSTSTSSMPERKEVTRALQAWKRRQDEEDKRAADQKQQANASR